MRSERFLAGVLLASIIAGLPATALAGYHELNLTDDKSTDNATSALFVIDLSPGEAFRFIGMEVDSITDLSVPLARQKPIDVKRFLNQYDGIRVSPGRFRLALRCSQKQTWRNRLYWQKGQITVDAEPGHAYLVSCVPRTKATPYPTPYVRETTPEELKVKLGLEISGAGR